MNPLFTDTFERVPRQSLILFDNIWEYQKTKLQFVSRADNLILDSCIYTGLVREGTKHGEPELIPHGFGRFSSSVYGWIYEGQIDDGRITGYGREFYGNGKGKFISAEG